MDQKRELSIAPWRIPIVQRPEKLIRYIECQDPAHERPHEHEKNPCTRGDADRRLLIGSDLLRLGPRQRRENNNSSHHIPLVRFNQPFGGVEIKSAGQ